MRRTGFARKMQGVTVRHDDGTIEKVGADHANRTDAERSRPAWATPLRPGVYSRSMGASAGRPKREYVRSEKMLVACRLIPCQACGRFDGTVCAAHSNWQCHGKGGHIKADDNRVAALCFACHGWLDQGSDATEEERQAMWWPAHCSTVKTLVAMQLWPDGVPVPSILDNPFRAPAACPVETGELDG